MPRARIFDPERERIRLQNFYMSTSDIIKSSLEKVKDSGEVPSASLLNSLVSGLVTLSKALDELAAHEVKRQREEARAELLNTLPASPTQPLAIDTEPKLALPFPTTLKGDI